ncbi:hypothetical protein Taro_033038 [Colocasia esculenta]|uniref:Uncharacterized protein n=1 Tax=Colocasia esculenta TaxID=4460 RepID=A0A843VU80_COLES|nr:hypothetical protein [Colocasia esculenta]
MDLLLINKASIRNSSSSSLLLLPLSGAPLLPFWMQELFPALLLFFWKSTSSFPFGVRGSWSKCVDTQADCVDTTGYWL